MLGTHVLDGHHVQFPTGQLGGQTHVLTVAADGLGQVGGFHGDVHGVVVFIDDDGGHIGWRHGVDHVLGRVVIVQHDVGTLTAQLSGDGLNAGTTHADTGTDRVDTTIVGLDRDLGAGTRITGGAHDFDHLFADFRHFDAEQLFQEVRAGAADEQLGTTGFRTHGVEQATDTVAGTEGLTGQHVVTEDHGFGIAAQIQDHVVAVALLDHAADDGAFLVLELVNDLGTLGLAHFLHDDLLGGLGGDTVEGHRVNLVFNIVADLDIRLLDLSGFESDFPVRVLHGSLIGHHDPTAIGVVVTGLAIDLDTHFNLAFVFFLGRSRQRSLQSLENLLAGDSLLVGHSVNDQQNLFIHIR